MLLVDRRLLFHFDWLLVGLTALLMGAGLLTLWSLVPRLAMRQGVVLGLGLLGVLVLVSIDYHSLTRWVPVAYLGGLLLLASVLVLGRSAQGAQRWLTLGPLTLQPSELFKLVLIATVARYLAGREEQPPGWDRIGVPLLLALPAFLLIVKQPDLGTAMVLLPAVLAMVVAGGARWRDLALLTGAALAAAPVLWFALKDYQRERILVYLDPNRDPLGSA